MIIREFLCIICTEGRKWTHIRETVSSAVCSHDTDMLILTHSEQLYCLQHDDLCSGTYQHIRKIFYLNLQGKKAQKTADIYITLTSLTVYMTNGEFKHIKAANVHIT